MDHSTKQALLEKLAKASIISDPVTIKHKGKRIATVLPIDDPQKFQTARNQEVQNLKLELNNFLTFIRSRVKQSSEDVEAQLAAYQQKIKQETHKLDDTL